MSAGRCRLRRNGNVSVFHTRQEFDEVIEAHNKLVDYCEFLEARIEELGRRVAELGIEVDDAG